MEVRQLRLYRLIVAGVLLIMMAFVAAYAPISSLSRNVFLSIYHMSDSLRPLALVVTQLGSMWMLLAVVGFLFVAKWRGDAAVLLLRNGTVTFLAAVLLKYLVDRPRPVWLLDGVVQRELSVQGLGFPSAHVALATAVSLSLRSFLPKNLRWFPVIWIGLVAWSRIYLGVHAPLDVLGGVTLGYLVVEVERFMDHRQSQPTGRRRPVAKR